MPRRPSLVEATARASARAKKLRMGIEQELPSLHVPPDAELLFIENVAALLGCSVDHVRRIPRRELPAAKIGTRLQYLRDDVIRYVRSRRDLGDGKKVIVGNARRPTALSPSADFDPTAFIKKSLAKTKKP